MIKKNLFLLVVFGFILTTFLGSVAAADADGAENELKGYDIMIVIDSSELMAKPFGSNGSRLDAVKSVMNKIVKELPENTYIGLRAAGYGDPPHSYSSGKTELLYPIGKIDKVEFSQKIDMLQPKEPVATFDALSELITDFVHKPGYGEYAIFISGGADEVGSRFCTVMEAMNSEKTIFNIDIVGVEVEQNFEEGLKCIASAGKGVYVNSSDIEELEKNIKMSFNRVLGGNVFAMETVQKESLDSTESGSEALEVEAVDEVAQKEGPSIRIVVGSIVLGLFLIGVIVFLVVIFKKKKEKEDSIAFDEKTPNVPQEGDKPVEVKKVEEMIGKMPQIAAVPDFPKASSSAKVAESGSSDEPGQVQKKEQSGDLEFGQVSEGDPNDLK